MNTTFEVFPNALMLSSMMAKQNGRMQRDDARSLIGQDDDLLIKSVAMADEQAYRELVNRHLKRILAFAHRHLGNEAEAEEVAQETFLRLWTKAESFQPGRARLDTWLHRIAYNLSIDIIRRRRQVALDDIAEPEDERQNQFRDYFDGQIADRVRDALSDLPERQRAALVLSHYQGLSNDETGQILGISVEAVKSLLSRARRKLRQSLASTMEDLKTEAEGNDR